MSHRKPIKEFKYIKAHPNFKQELEDIRIQRISSGVDNHLQSFRRLTQALLRHPKYPEIKKDMIHSRFIDDNEAQAHIFNIFTFSIVALITIVFFGGLIYISGLLNDVFSQVGLQNEVNAGNAGYVNMTEASNNTFGKMNESIQALRLVAIAIIFANIIGIFITNSLLRVHPLFFPVYVFIVLLAVFFAAPISNAYQDIAQSGIFGGNLLSFIAPNWVMLNLPMVVATIGILGAIFMFIGMNKGGETSLI